MARSSTKTLVDHRFVGAALANQPPMTVGAHLGPRLQFPRHVHRTPERGACRKDRGRADNAPMNPDMAPAGRMAIVPTGVMVAHPPPGSGFLSAGDGPRPAAGARE